MIHPAPIFHLKCRLKCQQLYRALLSKRIHHMKNVHHVTSFTISKEGLHPHSSLLVPYSYLTSCLTLRAICRPPMTSRGLPSTVDIPGRLCRYNHLTSSPEACDVEVFVTETPVTCPARCIASRSKSYKLSRGEVVQYFKTDFVSPRP